MTIRTYLSAAWLFLALGGEAAEFQLTLRVHDDFGKPVLGATGSVAIFQRWVPAEGFGKDVYKYVRDVTDQNGLVVLKGSGKRDGVKYGVLRTPGYYGTAGGEFWFRTNNAGRWQPWNPTIDIVLKPIVNPVPMYARHIKARLPAPAKEFGYDMMIGDWLPPFGKGQTTDFVFQVTGYWNSVSNYDSTLTLSFARPLDGIQEFAAPPPREGSELRSSREAPLNGYRPQWSWRRARGPGQSRQERVADTERDFNFFFRVRTVTDEQGRIKSALYGKLYEGFKFGGAVSNSFLDSGACYLNPEPNSRNMEFDLKRNLAQGLDWWQSVHEP